MVRGGSLILDDRCMRRFVRFYKQNDGQQGKDSMVNDGEVIHVTMAL